MDSPKRIQRRRTKGWRMPPNTLYVGRNSRWGNLFTKGTRAERVEKFIERMKRNKAFRPDLFEDFMEELRGKNLACWCPLNEPCHADYLLKIANQ